MICGFFQIFWSSKIDIFYSVKIKGFWFPTTKTQKELFNIKKFYKKNLSFYSVFAFIGLDVEYIYIKCIFYIFSDPPENISVTPKVVQVIENEMPDKLECKGWGYPEPTYQWHHKDELVSTSSVLNLGPIDRFRAGNYSCTAQNRHGKLITSAKLDVLCKLNFSFFFFFLYT